MASTAFESVTVNPKATAINRRTESVVNAIVRTWDDVLGKLHLGGRKAAYDDIAYEFIGGPQDKLRQKHYDKSLRLLWKAEDKAPWSSFRDATADEKALMKQALRSLTPEEKAARERLSSKEFRDLLDREYTLRQKQALVAVLSAIGHGEAYAWMVSASLLADVKSTGARAALTMQVLEEAKHFVVLRELVHAFNVDVPRLSGWEYMLMERVIKAKGIDKFFGMNIVVEGIALSIFGMLNELPGLDVLRLFHLDESRHTALPVNYLTEFPLSKWQQANPAARLGRIWMISPAIPLIFHLEDDLAQLGLDVLEVGGSIIRKVSYLAVRAGYLKERDADWFNQALNGILNGYARLTRPGHEHKDFHLADTTVGDFARQVEAEIFGAAAVASGAPAPSVASA